MKSTRQRDLEILEEKRDIAIDREHRQAILDSIYEQAKDPYLERMRSELITWMTRGLSGVPEEGFSPNLKQKTLMAEAERNIQRIEKEIKLYTANPEYQARLASKIAKSSSKEADLLMVKQKKGFL